MCNIGDFDQTYYLTLLCKDNEGSYFKILNK